MIPLVKSIPVLEASISICQKVKGIFKLCFVEKIELSEISNPQFTSCKGHVFKK